MRQRFEYKHEIYSPTGYPPWVVDWFLKPFMLDGWRVIHMTARIRRVDDRDRVETYEFMLERPFKRKPWWKRKDD